MRLIRKWNWHVRPVLFVAMVSGLLIGSSSTLSAGCSGAAETSPEQISTLRNLLSPATSPNDFHVYAETPSFDRKTHFVLYSMSKGGESGAQTVYLAAITLEPRASIVSLYDASAYLPQLTLAEPSNSGAWRKPEAAANDVDGCLDAFVLGSNLQAVHTNLFVRSSLSRSEAANDVVFVVLDQSSLRPVLVLNESSRYDHKSVHQDSVIVVLPSAAMASDLIWWQSSQEGSGMLTAVIDQNTWYRWSGKEFEKMGTLKPSDLATRLGKGFLLTRSNAISTVKLKLPSPGSDQPSP